MRIRTRGGTAALCVAIGLFGVPALGAHATAPAWAATATRGEPTTGLRGLGPVPAATPLQVTVALRLRNRAALNQAIAAGQTLTPAEFTAAYGPTVAATQAVTAYLQQQGFTHIETSANRVLVTADGTVGMAQSAFNTRIARLALGARTGFANLTGAQVPARLGAIVASVLGLNNLSRMTTPAQPAANPPSSCLAVIFCTYNPQGFWKAYDATTAPSGAVTTVAIFAEGSLTQVVKDLRKEEAANGLPQVPVTVVPTGPASPDTAGASEWAMDTQYSTGMAKTVKRLYVYDATSLNDPDITREFNRFVTQNVARAGSASFGECEYQAFLNGAMLADDQLFAEAAVQGQTVFASSGDTGGFCPLAPNNGVPVGAPDVSYPASSPYVVGVGGTSLLTTASGSWSNEIAWFAGGGGPSLFEPAPAWTSGVAPPLATACGLQALITCGRTVPDVAMSADPNISGANVYISGTPTGVGGTSLSSPLSLGVWARLMSGHANRLGFAAPRLYRAYKSAGFHDIILGDTGPYPALPGYDFATGMGTFDVAKMQSVIH